MTFSAALTLIRRGLLLYRKGWGKTPKYVYLTKPIPERVDYLELVLLKPTGPIRVPWLPNRCDLLTDDWEVYGQS